MSRELKFRVWNGMEMVYDVTVGKFGTFYVNPTNNGLDPNDSASLTPNTTRYEHGTHVMQSTGLLDHNGNEVYEGDLIVWPMLSGQINEVYWNQKECAFFAKPIDGEDKTESYLGGDCLVKGNIYQNRAAGV